MSIDKTNNWKEWEILAYEYVRDLYKETFIQEEKHTENSHDSGFDGLWLLRSGNNSLLKMILMEAKYRTSQSSLPLHDCAKAIIIAFNLSANQLYIVTNIPFAPQTKENVTKFKKRADLEITCVNGNELKNFIQKNKEYLIKECKISEAFIDKLEKTIIPCPDIETTLIQPTIQEYIKVTEREKQVDQIVKGLAFQGSICLLSGNAGSGKSVLCTKVSEELEKLQFDCNLIDLSLCTSSRVLYLSILESIWGVKLNTILQDSDLIDYVDNLLSVGDDSIDQGVVSAVKYILLSSQHKYENYKDIFLHLLLKYLDLILRPKRNNLKIVIFFENLNMLSEEIFIFLIDIIRNLRKNNIRIVLEARTPFLLQNLENIQNSKAHFQYLKEYTDLEYEISPFRRENSIELIKTHFSFTDRVCDSLANTLCDNPLEIHNAIAFLEHQALHFEKVINNLPTVELENYWKELGITLSTVTISLMNHLKNTSCFSQIFELSVILKGRISREIIEMFFYKNADEVIKMFVDSTVFVFCNNVLICNHLRYLDAMKKMSDINLRYQTAKKLLPFITNHKNIDEYYKLVELDILYILNDIEKIPSKTLLVSYSLMEMHQYKDVLIELLRCIKNIKENKNLFPADSKLFIELLLLALTCIRELHEENNASYEFIYNLAEESIILENIDFKRSKFWYEYQLMLWHQKFTIGNLKDAYIISKELYISLKDASGLFDEAQDYPGQVYNAYGLSVKMVNSGEEAKKIFDEGVTLHPHSHYAQAALLSQEGNQLLKYNPSAAIEKYQKLIKIVEGKQYPYQEVLHTKTDIAMSFFLLGNFHVSKIWAKQSSKEASTINMLSQKGRAENIYGCCLAAQMQYKKSIEVFKESIYLLEMSKSIIYLWRAQLNLVSVLFLQPEEKNLAKQLLLKVLNTLQYTFASKIKKDRCSVPYHGLLLVLMYLYEIEEYQIISDIQLKFASTPLLEDFSSLLTQKDWRNHFNTKVICYSGIVFVTG